MEVPLRTWKNSKTLFDQIEYAFTTLGVRYLEVRVTSDDEKAGA
jgi:hypothetical protein